MKYPMKEFTNFWGGTEYREMTAVEYEEQIQWYKNYMERHKNDTARRVQDYISYLKSWFGDIRCDGWPNFETRYTMHQLPMSFNVYTYG